MADKIKLPTKSEPLKVFPYRMNKKEQAEADRLCRKKYKVGLTTIIRTLILTEFPEAKTKPKL